MNGCGIAEGTKVRIVKGEYRGFVGKVIFDRSKYVKVIVEEPKKRAGTYRRACWHSVEVVK